MSFLSLFRNKKEVVVVKKAAMRPPTKRVMETVDALRLAVAANKGRPVKSESVADVMDATVSIASARLSNAANYGLVVRTTDRRPYLWAVVEERPEPCQPVQPVVKLVMAAKDLLENLGAPSALFPTQYLVRSEDVAAIKAALSAIKNN